jgi:hypothetical protein
MKMFDDDIEMKIKTINVVNLAWSECAVQEPMVRGSHGYDSMFSGERSKEITKKIRKKSNF